MTTTISHLPRDLAEEIFSKIPLKFMRAVRLTCKKWDTLSKNRSFTKMHLAKEGNSNSQMIVLMDYKLYLTSVTVNGTDVDPYTEPKGKLTCLNDSEQVKISQVFHCEGLLLCILKDTLRIVVWNPYWGQTRWIEPRYSYGREIGGVLYRYALGCSKNKKNKSLGSHKILRFIDDYFRPRRHHFLWYEIYDFDTGLWKTLDVTSPHWQIDSFDLGVSLKGNTYWIASERKPKIALRDHLICFDFTRERFGRLLPLPLPGSLWGGELATLSCVREEKLAALFQYEEGPIFEIWITTKIEVENVLWSKFLKVNDMGKVADIPISFRFGDFFIDEENRLAMVFDKDSDENRHTVNIIGEDGYFREVDLGEDGYSKLDVRASREDYRWRTPVCSYVPSLVQIKQFSGGCKTKQQNNLERHRCDNKTSRFAAIDKRIKQEELELR